MPKLSNFLLLKVAFRSFFIQASWNYSGMMNAGFLYAIKPALDIIHKNDAARKASYLRHLEYFNTNPYFSSVVMGVVLNLEEKVAKGEISDEIIRDTKEGLMTACAAIGDNLFWRLWRPFVAVISLLFAFNNIVATPLIFLFIYNIPHFYIRFSGIFWGYRLGTDVIRLLKKFDFQNKSVVLKYATITTLCYLISNHISIHTSFFINYVTMDWFYWAEKITQGIFATLIVCLSTIAYRFKINVFMISFLLMIITLLLYHWGILI